MTEKFCFFDSNHKRVKSFVTLTTSTYDPLLLAILECKHAVRGNIEVFWQMFNSAFKEVSGTGDSFLPTGFFMEMATVNFEGLVKTHGENFGESKEMWVSLSRLD